MSSESVRKAYSSVPYVSTASDLVDEIAALRMQVEGLERENEELRRKLGNEVTQYDPTSGDVSAPTPSPSREP